MQLPHLILPLHASCAKIEFEKNIFENVFMLLGVLKMEARFTLITYRISAQGSLTSSLLRATSCPKTYFENFKIVQKTFWATNPFVIPRISAQSSYLILYCLCKAAAVQK